MKTELTTRPAQAGSLSRALSAGAILAGLLLSGCSKAETKEVKEGDQAEGASAAATEGVGDQVVSDQSAEKNADSSSSSFRGGTERLDTGIDLSKIATADPGANPPAPVYDPVADKNAPPGHISLVEGQSQEHDFGSLRQGDVSNHVFRLTSDGDEPLVITRLKPSCGCTVAEVALLKPEGEREVYRTGEPIAPGTDFEIVAELNTQGKSGPISTSIAIYSNDPRAVFNLNLKAEVRPVLMIEPSATLAFGELSTVDSATGEVRVSSDSLEPFLLSVDDRYLQGQPVQVALTPVEPNAEGRSTEWNVGITIGPDFPREGINNFPVVLNTDQEVVQPKSPNPDGTPAYHQARVYAQATVLAMVAADPPFVSFGMMRPGEPIEKTVRISSMDSEFTLPENPKVRLEGYRGVEFQYADLFEMTVLPVEGGGALDLDIKMTGMPEGFSGSFGGVAIVEVGHPNKPEVQVRFSGVCRAGLGTQIKQDPSNLLDSGNKEAPADGHEGHDH